MNLSQTSETERAPETLHDERRRFALIGAGALGTALTLRLVACGYAAAAIFSRTESSALRLAKRVRAPVASANLVDLPPDVRLVFCTVPDDLLAGLANTLAEKRSDWSDCLVVQTSGALTARVLAPLAARGAHTLSFHPMQTFPLGTPPEVFEGIYVGLEGEPEAVPQGASLAADLGATSIVIPSEKKRLYHLAATCASNFFVTLMAVVSEILASLDVDQEASMMLVRPLVEQTWRNIQEQLPSEALTGPISRGDRDTMTGHTEALSAHLPHLLSIYTALATETVHLAVRAGRLSPADAQGLLSALKKPLEPPQTSVPNGNPPFV